MSMPQAALLVDALERLNRELSRSMPPPRGAPFYGVEYASGDFAPLDALCSRGIFRKYEHTLHLGAGLGGPARWLATRFGCTVVGVDQSAALAWAASRLTARARLVPQVRFLAAEAAALPLRERLFTHVWGGAALQGFAEPLAGLREAWRVLRPGAHFAIRLRLAAVPGEDLACWSDRVASAGFVDVSTEQAARPQASQSTQMAWQRLDRLLLESGDAEPTELVRRLRVARAAAAREESTTIIFARRPA
jgi:SAM-dependent methyltransferase